MRTIVTGVDQEEQSMRVLQRALAESASTSRPLLALHAWSTPTSVAGPTGEDFVHLPSEQDSARWAQDVADGLLAEALQGRAAGAAVTTSAREAHGRAGDVLVQADVDAGLIVVGARSHGPLLSAALGSATGRVLHHATCPVMVVPATAAAGPYRRVVVGFEDPMCSGSALRWALDAGRRHRCPVVVLHALTLTPSPVRMSAPLSDPRQEAETRDWLGTEVAGSGVDPDVSVTTGVRDGSPAAVLLGEAGADDLLVVGSRGRGGFAGLLLGSVAMQCAQHAQGVVVVVRPDEERLDDARAETPDSSTEPLTSPDGPRTSEDDTTGGPPRTSP